MSDAPERIWATHELRLGYYFTAKGPQPRFDDVEYIRADIHATEIAALQARNAALVEALLTWDAAHQTGRNEPLQVAFELGQSVIAAIAAERG